MSMFDDKYNNRNNRKSMGDDLLDGIGSSLPLAKELSEKITGHTVEGDIKNMKGYSDSELSQMSIEQLMKLKKMYRFRSVVLIPLAVILILTAFSGGGAFSVLIGAVSLILGFKSRKQYQMIENHLNVDK